MTTNENRALEQEIQQEIEHSEALKNYAEKVKTMRREELQQELSDLDDSLRDEEDELKRLIGQTGVHLYESQVEAYRESFMRETARIKEKRRLINEALKAE